MMGFKMIGLSAAILFSAGFLFASGQNTQAKNKSVESHEIKFVKPGAAIDLIHDYDGKTGTGELETFTLTLTHIYEAGYLTVSLLPPSGLHITSDINSNEMKLSAGSSFTLPVQFSTPENGAYSLGVETVYESPEGHQSRRVLSVPIFVGTPPQGKSKASESKGAQITQEGIIAMPAREVIK